MFRKFLNKLKEAYLYLKNEYKENSDSYIKITLTVICFLIFIFVLAFVIKMFLPYGIILLFLYFLYYCNKEPAGFNDNTQINIDGNIASNLLFDVLRDKVELLDIEKIKNISDIVPTAYPIIQNINGFVFYRFIVRCKNGCDLANDGLNNMLNTLNQCMQQKLQAGYPNVSSPMFRNLPYFNVLNIEPDLHHYNCLHIDVIPIVNDNCYSFVYNSLKIKYQKPTNPHVPCDKEF